MRRALAFFAALAAFAAVPGWAEGPGGAERLVGVRAEPAAASQTYGPFRVIDGRRAALFGTTDSASPAQFAAMLRDHPHIAQLDMIECPGTDDDTANLAVGRMIRAAGIATHVPANGSVRSGAVELFLAGTVRTAEDGAEFAVHAWRDSDGREPGDYPADSPVNAVYLDYYRQMGLARPQAFYDMTNAVPNADARWLTAQDMRTWLGEEAGERAGDITLAAPVAPAIAYLDFGTAFP